METIAIALGLLFIAVLVGFVVFLGFAAGYADDRSKSTDANADIKVMPVSDHSRLV